MEEQYKPRKLTNNEIEEIVNNLPEINSNIIEVKENITNQFRKLIRYQLEEIEIVPIGIKDLKTAIYNKFLTSFSEIGAAVGLMASESFGEPITQGTLNSHRNAGGLKEDIRGVDIFLSLVQASKNPKAISTNIVFKNKHLDSDQIFDLRKNISESSIGSLLKDSNDSVVQDLYTSIIEETQWWYNLFEDIYGKIKTSKHMLRLYISKYEMLVRNITLSEICDSIYSSLSEKYNNALFCVYSPDYLGIIDIYTNDDLLINRIGNAKLSSEIGMFFIGIILIPKLDSIIVKGIKNIQVLYPISIQIWSLVIKEEKLSINEVHSSNENILNDYKVIWKIILNKSLMNRYGLDKSFVIDLLNEIDFIEIDIKILYKGKYINSSKIKNIILTANKDSDRKPSYFINKNIETLEEIKEKLEEQRQKDISDENKYKYTLSKFDKVSKFWYAETSGSNLIFLSAHPLVDINHTISNDINEIYKMFGIEITRNFIILRLLEIIDFTDSYVNFRHISLLADYMTRNGVITKITGSSSKKEVGFLSAATHEQSYETFIRAASMGSEEKLENPSINIIIGKRPSIGTGYAKNEKLDREIDILINKLNTKKRRLDDNDFRKSLGNYSKLINSEKYFILEGEQPKPTKFFGEHQEDIYQFASSIKEEKKSFIKSRIEKRIEKSFVYSNIKLRKGRLSDILNELFENVPTFECLIPTEKIKIDDRNIKPFIHQSNIVTKKITKPKTKPKTKLKIPEIKRMEELKIPRILSNILKIEDIEKIEEREILPFGEEKIELFYKKLSKITDDSLFEEDIMENKIESIDIEKISNFIKENS